MARSLEELQKQYSRAPKDGPKGGMPMGPRRGGGPGGPRPKGKPKNMGASIKRLWQYVSAYRLRLAAVLLCMLFATCSSLCGGYLLAPIINKITLAVKPDAAVEYSALERLADGIVSRFTSPIASLFGGETLGEVLSYVLAALIILGGIYLISLVCTYLQSRLMLSVSQNATKSIRDELFAKMQRLPVRFFDSHPTGEVMSRYTNDIDNIDVMLNNSLTSIVSGAITLVGTFVFMLTTNWILTIVTIVFIPIFAKGGAAIAKRSSKFYGAQQAALGAVNGYMEETVTGQKVIKVFNHENTCVEEFRALNNDMRGKQFKAQFWGGIMGPIMGNTSQISYGITVGLGGVLMCLGMLSPGALTVFAGYSRQFSMPINQLSMQTSTIFAALAGAERVFAVMDTPPEEADKANARSAEGHRSYPFSGCKARCGGKAQDSCGGSCAYIGGYMVKRLVEQAERQMAGKQ